MGAASQELTDRARLLIAEQRYADAVRACRRALLSHPDQVEIRLLLGEALLALQRYDEARVEMIALTRKVPDLAAAHRLLGEAYLRDGRPTQAIESLRRARQLAPSDAVAQDLLIRAADASAPESTTIERWFADEAGPTVETKLPDWQEEDTPLPATAPGPATGPEQPSIQVDPSLAVEATRVLKPSPTGSMGASSTSSAARGPRVRSRKPTAIGVAVAAPRSAEPAARSAPELAPEPTSVQRPSGLRTPEAAPSLHTEEIDLAAISDELALPEPLEEEPFSLEEFPSMALMPDELSGRTTGAHFRPDLLPHRRMPSVGGPPSHSPTPAPSHSPTPAPSHSPTPAPSHSPTPAPSHSPTPAPAPRAAPPRAPPPARRPGPPAPSFPAPPPSRPPPSFAAPPPAPPPSFPSSSGALPAAALPARSAAPAAAPSAPAPSPPAPSPPAPSPPVPAPPRAAAPGDSTARVPRARSRWVLPAALAAVLLVALVALSTWGIRAWLEGRAKEEIREAARVASDSGARGDLEAAIGRIERDADDPELVALHARLVAVLTLEHDEDRGEVVEALLSRLEARPTDARIAVALLHLDRGEPGPALLELSGLTAEGEQIAEAFRARALATAALGRFQEAEDSAGQAAALRTTAPRHLALHALTLHQAGDSAGALQLLAAVPDGETSAAVRITRARVLQDSGSDPARALEDASAVLGPLEERSTPHQRAWAHLVRARHAVGEGDAVTAQVEARAARDHHPPADEAFSMGLVEALLEAGAAEDARADLARLPEPPIDRPGRALLSAEVALALDDLDGAERALTEATEGHRRTAVRAQVLEARGRSEEARPLYESLMETPGPGGRRARVRLAGIALGAGEAARAVALLEPLRGGADELEVAPLLARAYLAGSRLDEARDLVDGALARRPDAAELLAARGAVLLARGQVTEALAALRRAVEVRPGDVDLQVDLGDAALRAGEGEAARAAFEAALRLRPEQPRALLGMARVALGAGDLDAALARLEAVERTGREVLSAARVRGEVRVRRGDGASAIGELEGLIRRHDDPELWTSLGQLQLQAEQDRDAARSFGRALRRDRTHPEALLGQSLVDIRRGDLRGARRALGTAESQGERRALGPGFAARLSVARGRLEFENGSFEAAVRLAEEALSREAASGAAHLLLGSVASERGESPIEHLRRAAAAQAPPPEALGRLAPRLPAGEEACRLARRYLEVAPQGYDASSVREVAARCP